MRLPLQLLSSLAMGWVALCPAATDDRIIPYDVEQSILDNGLRVVLIPMPSDGLVTYWTLVRSGSGAESEPGKTGFAHFFEHMVFRGKESPGERIFVDGNGFTRDDFTAYHSTVASADLERLVEIEAHRFKNLHYSEEDFRIEAGAVYGEYRKDLTSPWDVLSQALLGTAFEVHPYNHLTLGHEEDIQRMPELYEYSLEFYRRYYRPDNMVLVLAGDFEPAHALALIKNEYADFEPGYDPVAVPSEPAQLAQRRVEVAFAGGTEPLVYIAFKSPGFNPSDKTVMAGTLLGELVGGRFSPLNQKLVLEQRRVGRIWTWFEPHRHPSLWGLSLRVKAGADVISVENEVWRAVEDLHRAPISQARLDTVRSYLRNRFVSNLSSPVDLASAVARVTALRADAGDIEQMYATLASVTPADIQRAATQWLRRETSTVAVLHAGDETPPSRLASEIESVLLPPSIDPMVTIKLWFKTGSQDDPPGKEGLAAITSTMLTWAGTEQRDLAELIRLRDPLGTRLSWIVDKEMTTFTWSVPRANLDAFYELLIETVTQPGFHQQDFERIRDANFRRVSKRFLNDSDEELAQFALSGEVFKGTRYEHHTQGTIESLPGLTIDDVKDFYRDHYTRDNVVFALSGSYPETLIERLRADLSRLGRGGARELVAIELAPIEGRRVVLMSKPGAPTSISFGVPIEVRRGSREFYALTIANAWLGQHRKGFGRLFDIIRRKRGLNYGNYSYIEAFKWRGSRMLPHSGLGRRQQMFEVWLRSLPREHAVFALRAALREIEKLAADGLTQGQFDMARKYVRRYSRFFAKSDGERLGYALDDVYYDITPGHLTRLRQMTDELTLDEVNAAVKKHFRIENLVIAIVTDDASGLKTALVSEMPSPVSYPQPASAKIVEEDKEIARHPLNISEENVKVISPEQVFMRRD